MSHRISILALMASLLYAAAGCQLHAHPTEIGAEMYPPAPTPALPYHVSDMRIETIPSTIYLYSPIHTSFNEIAGAASQTIPALHHLTAAGVVRQSGPVLFVYHDPSEDLSAPLDLEIGLPLREAPTATLTGFNVRTASAFRCATVIYRGPMNLLPKAYDKLIPEMIAAGLVPSVETRESYVVWESPDSSGNVVQIEVGIR